MSGVNSSRKQQSFIHNAMTYDIHISTYCTSNIRVMTLI